MSEQTQTEWTPPGETNVLEASDLRVSYGQIVALRGIDLCIGEGEIVAIIGPNGAGKTTFADTAAGFLPYEGMLKYRGREINEAGESELVDDGMIYCTEKRDLFPFLTVDQNLTMGAFRARDDVEERKSFVYDLFPVLEDRQSQKAQTMSGGEQQMLAIGRALMGDPDLLVLDEPTLGLAPVILEDISEAIESIRDQGMTILLAEQNVTFALNHADRIYLFENGSVIKTGTADEMAGDDYLQETYLGG